MRRPTNISLLLSLNTASCGYTQLQRHAKDEPSEGVLTDKPLLRVVDQQVHFLILQLGEFNDTAKALKIKAK